MPPQIACSRTKKNAFYTFSRNESYSFSIYQRKKKRRNVSSTFMSFLVSVWLLYQRRHNLPVSHKNNNYRNILFDLFVVTEIGCVIWVICSIRESKPTCSFLSNHCWRNISRFNSNSSKSDNSNGIMISTVVMKKFDGYHLMMRRCFLF